MFMKHLFHFSILVLGTFQIQNMNECLEGETWYEFCEECKCLGEGNYSCESNNSNCIRSLFLDQLLRNVTIFFDDRRCHYSYERERTICVEMTYQKDLNGTRCMEDSYFYDTCTFCKCDLTTLKYVCNSNNNQMETSGGVCNPEQKFIENICYECICTFTRFRFCRPLKPCFDRKEKPGKCPVFPFFYSESLQDFCIYQRYQECYTDYGCSGTKKCCQLADCFFRCVNPIEVND